MCPGQPQPLDHMPASMKRGLKEMPRSMLSSLWDMCLNEKRIERSISLRIKYDHILCLNEKRIESIKPCFILLSYSLSLNEKRIESLQL